jgi:hypothetical protein
VPDRAARRHGGTGKQPGAGGATRQVVADPDEIVEHVPVTCQ